MTTRPALATGAADRGRPARYEHVQELRRGSRAQPHTPARRKGTRAAHRRRALSDSANQ